MTSSASRSGFTARVKGFTARAKGFLALAVAAALGSSACSTPTDTQPYSGICAPFNVATFQPAEDAVGVPRDVAIRLVFDDYPDPDTVDYGGVILTTGVYFWGGTFSTDLVGKAIDFRPSGLLRATLGFNLTIQPPLRSLRGCAAEMKQISFRTGTDLSKDKPPPPVPAAFADVRAIFAASCGGGACHRAASADGGGCLDAPAAALSLCDRDARAAVLGVPSRQVSRLLLVAPHDSSRSYLLRKLLPGATPDVPAATTLGHRDPPGAPLTSTQLRVIATWIDAGANL